MPPSQLRSSQRPLATSSPISRLWRHERPIKQSQRTSFATTDACKWLRAGGYLNARRFGFVPSYPVEAPTEGPVAEPWEWQWVGVDALYRCPPTP